ncbi:MAG TPA: VCBS repeat-containing protein, partial [Planctomycetota bacterium]|nr:VCBS repeat-containing protein [Planctomycetota bacterium]
DLLVTNWQNGQLKAFFQQNQAPVAGPSIPVGAGPIALGVARLGDNKRTDIGVLTGVAGKLVLTSVGEDRTFAPVKTIPMPAGGPAGWVLPWNSAQAGPGFLCVVPLAEAPLQFVPYSKGSWGSPVPTSIAEAGVITSAVVLQRSKDAPQRLVLGISGDTNRLAMFEEKDGKFTACCAALTLPQPPKGLVAADFNRDGREDVFVIQPDRCGFYFVLPAEAGETLAIGPQFSSVPRLLGPATVYRDTERGPELLLITEERKAVFLKPSVLQPPAVEPDAAPAKAEEKKDEAKPAVPPPADKPEGK